MVDTNHAEAQGALSGVRILDITNTLMGPYATLILADLGAEVIKVESPAGAGDIARFSIPARSNGMGQTYLNNNRNKRSIALDLKNPDGRDALLALAKHADVFVYNARPKAMVQLKLDYEDLKAVNPKIIYVGGLGFSQRGRYGGRPAYDDLIQGMAGLPWLYGRASGQTPRYVPLAHADRASALHLVIAVLAALQHVNRTGRGQRVDVPMFENLVHALLGEHMTGETFIPAQGPMGHKRTLSAEHRPFRTKDGFVCTLIHNDKQWRAFFKLIGQPEKFDQDARFSSRSSRAKNLDVVNEFLCEVLQTRTSKEWTELFTQHDLPIGPMNSLEDVLNDPHLADVGFFKKIEHPTEGSLRAMYYPTEFSETPVTNRRFAPLLGQHTVELLTEVGYAPARIDDLIAKGVAISTPAK